jgi:3-phosphoshikimate 1-carboxyvinyltransferase
MEGNMIEHTQQKATLTQHNLYIAPTSRIHGAPEVPSSKYYTLRYVLAAVLADGESRIVLPAQSDDTDALLRGSLALGADLQWEGEQQRVLQVKGVGRPHNDKPVTINVGNAGAVSRLLLGLGAALSEVTFVTDHPQSLGKRPNRELLAALTTLGAKYTANGAEGY